MWRIVDACPRWSSDRRKIMRTTFEMMMVCYLIAFGRLGISHLAEAFHCAWEHLGLGHTIDMMCGTIVLWAGAISCHYLYKTFDDVHLPRIPLIVSHFEVVVPCRNTGREHSISGMSGGSARLPNRRVAREGKTFELSSLNLRSFQHLLYIHFLYHVHIAFLYFFHAFSGALQPSCRSSTQEEQPIIFPMASTS